jgi:hypothetical protein
MTTKTAHLASRRREYHARLLKQGKTVQAESYRLSNLWAFPIAGGEGGQVVPDREMAMNQPSKPNYNDKGITPSLRNEIVELVDRRIREVLQAREEKREVVPEEAAVIYEKVQVPVVWHGDPEGTVEAVVVAAPKNVRIRLIEIEGVSHRMWVVPSLWPMVGWKVAVKPHDIEGEGGWTLVGEYGRKGGRIV